MSFFRKTNLAMELFKIPSTLMQGTGRSVAAENLRIDLLQVGRGHRPLNITRDCPPLPSNITRDCPPSLLICQGIVLLQVRLSSVLGTPKTIQERLLGSYIKSIKKQVMSQIFNLLGPSSA